MQKAARFLSPTRRGFAVLEESAVVAPPPRPTTVLLREHFNVAPSHLKYPSSLDFSHENFKLRSLALLLQIKETAVQEIVLSDNELQSLADLNRFTSLKVLVACRNALVSGPGVRLTAHKLTRLDLSGNKLSAVPPLQDLPLLQVLNLSRNQISAGWWELQACAGLQALDASHNELSWDESEGELSRAVAVLRALKKLRVLSLRASRLKGPSAPSEDCAPSAFLGHLKARAAPLHPRAKPEPLGGSPRPQEPGSGRPPKVRVDHCQPPGSPTRRASRPAIAGGRSPLQPGPPPSTWPPSPSPGRALAPYPTPRV